MVFTVGLCQLGPQKKFKPVLNFKHLFNPVKKTGIIHMSLS